MNAAESELVKSIDSQYASEALLCHRYEVLQALRWQGAPLLNRGIVHCLRSLCDAQLRPLDGRSAPYVQSVCGTLRSARGRLPVLEVHARSNYADQPLKCFVLPDLRSSKLEPVSVTNDYAVAWCTQSMVTSEQLSGRQRELLECFTCPLARGSDAPADVEFMPCADCQVSLASSEVYAWLGRSDALELMPVPQSALLKVQGVQRVCIDDVEHPCDPRQAHPLSCKCISMKLWLATMGRGWASPSVWRAEGSLHDCLFVDTRRKKNSPVAIPCHVREKCR